MLDNVYYINLDSRTDRKQAVEKELNTMGWKYNRFSAIKNKNGRIGCSMSHLQLIKMAKEKDLPYIVIIEDDIHFTKPKWYNEKLGELLKEFSDYDVVLLAGNLRNPVKKVADTVLQIKKSWTTTGYIVQKHYYQTLIDNITEGIAHLIREPEKHYMYAIDAYWMKLQNTGKWYIVYPRTVTQRPEYSDIEGEYKDYTHLFLDVNN